MHNFLKSERTIISLILAGFLLIILGTLFFTWKEYCLISTILPIKADKFGQYGDFIGGFVGTLWSLASVLLFYLALTEQRKDFQTNQNALNLQVEALNNQIEEFQLQRVELESSRRIYEEQTKTLRLQQFESNFYAILNVYVNIKNNLSDGEGTDYFEEIFFKYSTNYDSSLTFNQHHREVVRRYMEFFNTNSNELSHYFKCFYRIVKIIDTHLFLTRDEKDLYAKILRSQLTDYEQLLLFYNSFSPYGEKVRPLILKYNILKHIPNFDKSEYIFYSKKQQTDDLVFFYSWLCNFLKLNLKNQYDIDFGSTKIEEECPYFSCIVGIYFGETFEVRIYCLENILQNGINLTPLEFQTFVAQSMIDLIQIRQYVKENNFNITEYITDMNSKKIFGFVIESNSKIEL